MKLLEQNRAIIDAIMDLHSQLQQQPPMFGFKYWVVGGRAKHDGDILANLLRYVDSTQYPLLVWLRETLTEVRSLTNGFDQLFDSPPNVSDTHRIRRERLAELSSRYRELNFDQLEREWQEWLFIREWRSF